MVLSGKGQEKLVGLQPSQIVCIKYERKCPHVLLYSRVAMAQHNKEIMHYLDTILIVC